MPPRPERWTIERLLAEDLEATVVWSTRSVSDLVSRTLGAASPLGLESLGGVSTIIAVGGGTLLDRAKWMARERGALRLIAIPSLWGSGAEASPVVVMREGNAKTFLLDERFTPDVRVVWPELALSLPEELARMACGDAWAHALEGFLSPLATPEQRKELAAIIVTMVELPIGNDARWFDVSAHACAAQARASVGLIHGIAHVLEPQVASAGGIRWGHAGLCSTWLLPVMLFNLTQSGRAADLLGEHGLPVARIVARLEELFDAAVFAAQRELLASQWRAVLHDPSSRTNATLVRPASLEFFQEFDDATARAAAFR